MKKLIFLFLFTLSFTGLFAQDYIVNIKFTEGERSKDSHSKTVTISLNGLDATRKTETEGMNKSSMTEEVKLGKADLERIQMLGEVLKGTESITATSTGSNVRYNIVEVTVINKEDKADYSFSGLSTDAESSASYKKLKEFYKEVDGLIDCHIEQ